MTIQGFLDFQEGTIWQSDVAFNEASLGQGTGTTVTFPASGTYVCSNWQATQFRCTTGSRIFDYTAQWFTDAAATNQIGERRWSVYDGWPLPTYLTLGNLGPYLRVQVSNFSGGSGNALFRGIFTNRPLGPFQPGYSTPMLDVAGTSVGAGATVTVTANFLYAGPASIWVFTPCVTWFINVYGAASDGALHRFTHFGNADEWGAAQDRRQSVVVPPLVTRIDIVNQTAGAQPFYCALTPDVFR